LHRIVQNQKGFEESIESFVGNCSSVKLFQKNALLFADPENMSLPFVGSLLHKFQKKLQTNPGFSSASRVKMDA
jgi:hypothetical protein